MKDTNDKSTLDAFDAPRPGRPVTGKAKSRAQIQREYRERTRIRDAGLVMLRLNQQETRDLLSSVGWSFETNSDPQERVRLAALWDRLGACLADFHEDTPED